MLLIDKASNEQTLYTTLSELSVGVNPTYSLVLFNYYTNTTYNYDLITTTYSNARYDRVVIELDTELNTKILDVGQYSYVVFQYANVVEKGLVKVIDSSIVETTYEIVPDEEDDDFISYNPEG